MKEERRKIYHRVYLRISEYVYPKEMFSMHVIQRPLHRLSIRSKEPS